MRKKTKKTVCERQKDIVRETERERERIIKMGTEIDLPGNLRGRESKCSKKERERLSLPSLVYFGA